MQNMCKTKNNNAEADIKLNFKYYMNWSKKASDAKLNLTGSHTELFDKVGFVALCERQYVGDDQRTRRKWRLSCLNTRSPKLIMYMRFFSGLV